MSMLQVFNVLFLVNSWTVVSHSNVDQVVTFISWLTAGSEVFSANVHL